MGNNAVATAGAAPSYYKLVNNPTRAYLAKLAVSGRPAKVIMLKGYNSGPLQFLQLHDSVAEPVDEASGANLGAKPMSFQAIAANDNFSLVIPVCGLPETVNGLYVCNSSTGPYKTVGAADCWFEVYIA